MSTALVLREQPAGNWAVYVAELRRRVLLRVASEHSKRNYAKALDEIFALCEERQQPLSRALLMGYRAAMLEKKLSNQELPLKRRGLCRDGADSQRCTCVLAITETFVIDLRINPARDGRQTHADFISPAPFDG